jgi:hypothetical protein
MTNDNVSVPDGPDAPDPSASDRTDAPKLVAADWPEDWPALSPELADANIAAQNLISRTGALNVEIAYYGDDDELSGAYWAASVRYQGTRIGVEAQPGPVQALEALVARLMHGAVCMGCSKLIAINDEPVPVPASLVDGYVYDRTRAEKLGICHWTRQGRRWVPECGDHPAPADSSREKLARALAEEGAPAGMIRAARESRWDDFRSEYPFPQMLLVRDLQANGLAHLVPRVLAGEFDGTQAEADEWMRSEDGQQAIGDMAAEGGLAAVMALAAKEMGKRQQQQRNEEEG